MRKIEQGTVAVSLDEKSLMVTLEQEKTKWSWKEGFRPYFLILKKKEKNIHTVLKH